MSSTTKTAFALIKANPLTAVWSPLESGTVRTTDRRISRVRISDGARTPYLEQSIHANRPVRFRARGVAGRHLIEGLGAGGEPIAKTQFILKPRTQ